MMYGTDWIEIMIFPFLGLNNRYVPSNWKITYQAYMMLSQQIDLFNTTADPTKLQTSTIQLEIRIHKNLTDIRT